MDTGALADAAASCIFLALLVPILGLPVPFLGAGLPPCSLIPVTVPRAYREVRVGSGREDIRDALASPFITCA